MSSALSAISTPAAKPVGRNVPYVNFPAQYAEERTDILACVEDVFSRGEFIGGALIDQLEAELAELCGTRHAVTLNSGTDALILAMKVLGIKPGDEVITPPNSFLASAASIALIGARPVFVDVKPDQNIDPAAVEAAITPRTVAIMPVHLTGRMADMTAIRAIAGRHGLLVIEDAAQSIGSSFDGMPAGAAGDIGCFSAHPLKNLNAAGDAGFVTLNDDEMAARLRRLRNHGMINRDTALEFGYVSRLDTLQAAILRMRLRRLGSVTARRRHNAERYRRLLRRREVFAPPCQAAEFNTFHTFVIQADRRDKLREHLLARGVQTSVHYPVPIHLQPAAAHLGHRKGDFPTVERQAERILSLPINQFISDADIDYVAGVVDEFYGERR